MSKALSILNNLEAVIGMPLKALRASRLPITTRERVMAISLEEAYERIFPFFPAIKQYSSANKLAGALLSQNFKLEKIGTQEEKAIGLALSPHKTAGHWLSEPVNFCIGASKDCIKACLNGSGHNVLEYNEQIKICRSVALLADPEAFLRLLVHAIDKLDPRTFIRLNVLSDIPWELVCPWLFEMYSGNDPKRPRRRFYDYTKIFGRNPPGNYHLVHSYSGYNAGLCKEVMGNGGSVAVVGIRERPKTFWNYQTVDGDAHDIRPIDRPNSIVWLKLKSTPNNSSLRDSPFFNN
tara:strand:- start:479 stop:1357 length:879 start_codon:yes stop_codon:yes gene_type:complete